MGRSAKFHKRQVCLTQSPGTLEIVPTRQQNKKTTSSAGSTTTLAAPAPKPQAAAPKEQKKQAGLKAKAAATAQKREGDGPVLGGADYVELMFGSRRSARAEAAKLPKPKDPEA